MKNLYVNIILDLKNADSGVKMANLNKSRKVGKMYEAERLNKIGMLPEHLKL
jgi:hypothetical protein